MDYIFIDTSEFVKNNFLYTKEIQQVLSFAENETVTILLPEITYNEILERANISISEAATFFPELNKKGRMLRNFSEFLPLFVKIDKSQLNTLFKETFDKIIAKSKITIIAYPTLNIKYVFDKYFNKSLPFSNSKRTEFKDAFALYTLELWCEENNKTCYIFSQDPDLVHYESEYLKTSTDLKTYISNKLTELELINYRTSRLDLIQRLYIDNKDKLIEVVNDRVTDYIYENASEFTEYGNEFEDFSVDDVTSWLGDYRIVSITDVDIIIESTAEFSYKISLQIDDEDSALYDPRNHSWSYENQTDISLSDTDNVFIQFIIVIPASGKFENATIDIYDINLNQRW